SGWRWGGTRPATWPERTPGVPEPASNLDWARQEPIRSLRWLIQRGLSVPFTRAMTGLDVEGAGWLRDQERPRLLISDHGSPPDPAGRPARPRARAHGRRRRGRLLVRPALAGPRRQPVAQHLPVLAEWQRRGGAAQLQPAPEVGLEPDDLRGGHAFARRPPAA